MQQPPDPYAHYPQQQPPNSYNAPTSPYAPLPPYNYNPPPKQPSGFRHWLRTRSRKVKLGLGCGTIIAALLLCICAASAYGSTTVATTPTPTPATGNATIQQTPTDTPTPSPSPTQQPTPTPTMTPTPTATTASKLNSAVLGAQLSAFTAKFSQPNDHSSSSEPHLARCNTSNIDQLILLQTSNQSASGPITSIDFNFCPGANNSVSTAEAVCSTFFPADAVYQKTVTIPGSSSQFAQFDRIYYSAALAHEFTADNFTDANQNPVKPGLFDADYLYANNNDTSHIDSCTIQLGTQQTQ